MVLPVADQRRPDTPAHLSEGPRCHSPFGAPDGAHRPPFALAAALVVSACGDSDDPATTDDATTTTSTPVTSAPTPTSGDDATTSTSAGDTATGPEEVAAFDGFSVWLDDTGSYLLRLDESWVPQDDGTVTTPGGDGPVRLVVDGAPTRLVMAEWTDLGTLAEGERELALELLDDQGEPVSDGGTAGTVTVEATDEAPHAHDDDGAEWAEPPSLSIELSEVPTGGWMIRSGRATSPSPPSTSAPPPSRERGTCTWRWTGRRSDGFMASSTISPPSSPATTRSSWP